MSNTLILILIGAVCIWLGVAIYQSNVRFRLFYLIPIPKILISGIFVLAGIGVAISGFLASSADGPQLGSERSYTEKSSVQETEAYTSASSYVSGYWGEKFVRSNGYSYPFVFNEPLTGCKGFTLDYVISEVSGGNLSGNFRYEVYVRTVQGNWKSVELFQMDGYEKTVTIYFDDPMSIDAVAVVCGKKSEVTFSYSIGVRDPF